MSRQFRWQQKRPQAAATAQGPEHHRGAISMMFEAILSALTLIGYLIPQVLWAIRRGR
jgi:hypothetical protein